jgi:hypothetical protein
MTLGAIHFLLQHRVVLRELKLALLRQMALEAGRWILAGIDDEFTSSAAALDMQAGGSVT